MSLKVIESVTIRQTLKSRSKVTQSHRNRHTSTHHLWIPINVPE